MHCNETSQAADIIFASGLYRAIGFLQAAMGPGAGLNGEGLARDLGYIRGAEANRHLRAIIHHADALAEAAEPSDG
jgi:hypothetical protein